MKIALLRASTSRAQPVEKGSSSRMNTPQLPLWLTSQGLLSPAANRQK
jgi:hypothetical protein